MSAHSSRGRAWERTRAQVLERDGHLCQICRTAPATQVDHRTPKAKGGTDDPSNLVASCQPCNLRKGDRAQYRVTWRSPRWFTT